MGNRPNFGLSSERCPAALTAQIAADSSTTVNQPRRTSHPTLSADQVGMICRGLLDLAEDVFRYKDQLENAGFRGFLPRLKFAKSFCASQAEKEIHERCIIEQAKFVVGWPWPPVNARWTDAQRASLYRSPLFEQLRNERDKTNAVPESELATRFPAGEVAWRREINPCRRRQLAEKADQQSNYKECWNAVLGEEARVVEEEIARHATGISRAHTFDESGRYRFFSAVMERDAARLGFDYDKAKSRSNYPVFSKRITEDWDVCWALEEERPFFWNPFEGRFAPFLEIRGRTRRGRMGNAAPGEFLQIRYASIIPGFFNAYRNFYSLEGLETMIKAHVFLYELLAPVLEEAVRNGLEYAEHD